MEKRSQKGRGEGKSRCKDQEKDIENEKTGSMIEDPTKR